MNISGNILLSDSSRYASDSGTSGYFFNVAPPDFNNISSLIYDSTTVGGDQTFLQEQILGPGDLTLVLQKWGYIGGYHVDATTIAGGRWATQWFDPDYIKYSIWYLDYDSSQYSLVGYKFRDPTEQNVGNFYAPMVVPDPPGHYQIRWLYSNDDTVGKEVVKNFTSLSRGIDGMRDYPFPLGIMPYPYDQTSNFSGSLVITLPVYEYRNPGDTAVFTLQINGPVPFPITYQWRFNGNNMADSTRITGTTTDTLIISPLILADGGIYTCVVSDMVVSTWAFLIMDPP